MNLLPCGKLTQQCTFNLYTPFEYLTDVPHFFVATNNYVVHVIQSLSHSKPRITLAIVSNMKSCHLLPKKKLTAYMFSLFVYMRKEGNFCTIMA
jgi:hypothetical protein